jgi:hypothetical protein
MAIKHQHVSRNESKRRNEDESFEIVYRYDQYSDSQSAHLRAQWKGMIVKVVSSRYENKGVDSLMYKGDVVVKLEKRRRHQASVMFTDV